MVNFDRWTDVAAVPVLVVPRLPAPTPFFFDSSATNVEPVHSWGKLDPVTRRI